MIVMRPYQINLIERILHAIKIGYRKILITAPTGAGKTVIMGGLLSQIILAYGTPNTIISVPYTNLIFQIQSSLAQQDLISTIETYGSTRSRGKYDLDLLMIDEAHHVGSPSGQDLLRMIQCKLLLGFTATPFRLDRNPLLMENGGPFEVMIAGPSIAELTEQGYLANLNYYNYPLLKEVHTEYYYLPHGTRGKRDIISYRVESREHRVVEEYQQGFNGIPSFVFCKTISQAENVASKFNGVGIRAGYLSGYHKKSVTAETIRQFKDGELQILAACNMASEGMDITRAKLVIMARKIVSSVTLFIQQVGRALRPDNGQDANVLDLCGNYYTFGTIEHAYNMEVI